MDAILPQLANRVRNALRRIAPPVGGGRPTTTEIYKSLKSARNLVAQRFGGPIFSRYSGCVEDTSDRYRRNGRVFRVLEYLWDFSFSRFTIPQAIGDRDASPLKNGKFELILVAESELGTKDEICRDLLKLLEARCQIRCLVYKQPKRNAEREAFHARMISVLHNHAHFENGVGIWLFIGLTWSPSELRCEFFTLNESLSALVPVPVAD